MNFKYLLFSIPLLVVMWLSNGHFVNTSKEKTADLVWLTNLEEAQKISKKTGKPIMADFTGSDWCGWCHKLSNEVFNTPEFKTWSDKNVVLLELDFPRTIPQDDKLKAQNNELLQFFQVQGFPTIWVFDMQKDEVNKKMIINPIGKTGYLKGGPKVFTDAIDGMIAEQKAKKNTKKNEIQPAR